MADPDRLRAARSGESVTVPIGQTFFTNKREAQGELTDTPMVALRAFADKEGKKIVRDSHKNALQYTDAELINERRVVEASYKNGTLVLVRKNGEEFYVEGFPIQSDFGIGPTGPRGDPGADGRDGIDGDDGDDGDVGCAGPKGEEGAQGQPGKDGKDGDQGARGPDGCEGAKGEQGPQGPMGINGYEGARGATGPVCASTSGSSGPAGPALKTHVVISSNVPDNLTVLWGVPQ